METYNNDYKREEDDTLWEIHEIRHELSKEYSSMTSAEINLRARNLFGEFQRKNHSSVGNSSI